jgi:hypothetical protein
MSTDTSAVAFVPMADRATPPAAIANPGRNVSISGDAITEEAFTAPAIAIPDRLVTLLPRNDTARVLPAPVKPGSVVVAMAFAD